MKEIFFNSKKCEKTLTIDIKDCKQGYGGGGKCPLALLWTPFVGRGQRNLSVPRNITSK
jgi:hypothetical protein